MRVRRVRVEGGGECVALWHGQRWAPLGPALRGDSSPELERAAGDLVALLGGGPGLWEEARTAVARADESVVELPALLPFVPRSFRDFSLWERHMVDAARGIARRFLPPRRWRAVQAYERTTGRTFPLLKPGANWYQHPIYYKGNHLAFVPDGAAVVWPWYTQALDYELELGVVIARPLCDATPSEALDAIGGYVLVCDWSARDVQIPEMSQGGFGPAKSKDFANSLGAEVVTADELGDLGDLHAEVRVNGETWGRGRTGGMRHTIAEMVAYASRGERLVPGELLATGTVPGCSGAEVDRWLSPGDEVELELTGLGTLHATVGTPRPAPAGGNLRRARWTVVPRGGFGPEVPAIDPQGWDPPPPLPLAGALATDTRLDEVERWEVPGGRKPEDVVVDSVGRVLTGVEDGRIYRFAPDGSRAELVADTHGRPLGLELDAEGRLLVCDAHRGLLRVTDDAAVEVLVDAFDGRRMRFVNNAAVGPDGTVYFSDSSTRFPVEHYPLDALEHRGNGRLFAYHPQTGETERLLDGLYFPNGVALAPDASFVLVAETWRYQVRRLWLQGSRAGRSDVLVDRLPGFPDNMSARGDGTYWLALPDLRQPRIDALLPRPTARRAVAALPARFRPGPARSSVVVRFDGEGLILDSLHGPGGAYAVVTGVREHAGHLYLGSLVETAIARVAL